MTSKLLLAFAVLCGIAAGFIVLRDQSPNAMPELRTWREIETPRLAPVLARSAETTAIAELQPLQQLATAIAPHPVTADPPEDLETSSEQLTADVRRDLAAALLTATDGAVMMLGDDTMHPDSTLRRWSAYWLAVWPDLDDFIADGSVQRTVSERAPDASNYGGFVLTKDKRGIVCSVEGDQWTVTLTFARAAAPLPEAFEQLYPPVEKR